jgi:hypothetical protein
MAKNIVAEIMAEKVSYGGFAATRREVYEVYPDSPTWGAPLWHRLGGLVGILTAGHRCRPLGLLQALHHCDNPPCCNPRHLYAGTVQDNVRDRDARGRRPTGDQVPYENRARGSRHPDAALNETQVAQIRSELQRGCSYANLADRYGVSKGAIAFIARNRTWKHVPWPNGDRDD